MCKFIESLHYNGRLFEYAYENITVTIIANNNRQAIKLHSSKRRKFVRKLTIEFKYNELQFICLLSTLRYLLLLIIFFFIFKLTYYFSHIFRNRVEKIKTNDTRFCIDNANTYILTYNFLLFAKKQIGVLKITAGVDHRHHRPHSHSLDQMLRLRHIVRAPTQPFWTSFALICAQVCD